MIDFSKDKYIILELIPEAIDPSKGNLLQVSALKLEGLKLLDRFDYRLNEDKINIKEFINMLNYGKEYFTYVDDSNIILDSLKTWLQDLPILLIDDTYTLNYLKEFNNKKELIFNYLDMEKSEDIIDRIIKKYNLEASPYIVDILYEALIYQSNKN